MDFYCYLLDMKNESQVKRITVDESESDSGSMSLDEMIWNLGMSLPSWDDLQSK
jgi:hypothetical protein